MIWSMCVSGCGERAAADAAALLPVNPYGDFCQPPAGSNWPLPL